MTARHRETHTGVRMRSGGLLAGILALCLLLLGIGAIMAGSGTHLHAQHAATDTSAGQDTAVEAAARMPYRGPLPTGMVGLVTVGAQAVGTGSPRASMTAPTSATPAAKPTPSTTAPTTSAGTTVAADSPTTPDSTPAMSTSRSPGVRTTATPAPTTSWPYQYPYPWPTWPPPNH